MIRPFFKPLFNTPINENVTLYKGSLSLPTSEGNIAGMGSITYKWQPYASIVVEMAFDEKHSLERCERNSGKITVANVDLPFRLKSWSIYGCQRLLPFYQEGDTNAFCDKFRFEVPNLMTYAMAQEMGKEPTTNHHSLILSNKEYEFELQNSGQYGSYSPFDGGFILNGRGEIRFHKKKSTFKECQPVFDMIACFLTFLHGRKLAPLFIEGYSDGSHQFKFFLSKTIDENAVPWNWFAININTVNNKFIQCIWESFVTFYKNEEEKECLTLIVHWYIEGMAARGGIEASLVLIQNALELLCSRIIVEREHVVDHTDYDKMSTATLINILLSWTQVSNRIPEKCNALTTFAKANNLFTGPSVLTYVRNAIVHPHSKNRKRYRSINNGIKNEALELAIYYVELVTLKYLGYNGSFYNRMWNGPEIERRMLVPWSTQVVDN